MYETRLAGSGVPPAAPRGPSGAPCSSTRRRLAGRPAGSWPSLGVSMVPGELLGHLNSPLRKLAQHEPNSYIVLSGVLDEPAACSSTVPRKGPAEQPAAPRIQPAGFHTPSAHVRTRWWVRVGPGTRARPAESIGRDRSSRSRVRRAHQIFLGQHEPSTRSITMVGDCLQALAAKFTLRSENSSPARNGFVETTTSSPYPSTKRPPRVLPRCGGTLPYMKPSG